MSLADFCKSLPLGLTLAPIYAKGQKMESGAIATGKNPVEAAFKRNLNRDDAALILERSSKVSALGLFTGQKGNGVVILDVDANLTQLRKKWGDSLDGAPCITSTRQNAAKFVFRVPEELWGEVSGWMHSQEHNLGYECLWGRQGLIQGVYPGSKDGKSPEGEYTCTGDFNALPAAPAWLVAEMKAAKAPSGGIVKNRAALKFDERTDDEKAQIIQECLDVITGQGTGSREQWIDIGMAIHNELPDERGLELWSEWSAKDPEFAEEWQRGNPCQQPWSSFKQGGGKALGTLIWEADKIDPERTRFPESSKRIVAEAEARRIQEIRATFLPYEEVIKRGMQAYQMDDIPKMNYELHKLAKEANYRDQGELEQLITDYISANNKSEVRTLDKFTSVEREYVIPGLLPSPYTVLVHGREGSGKSASVICLMKHIVDGIPFQLKGQEVKCKQGPVIYFNSDMSDQDFQEEAELHEIKNKHLFHTVGNFNIYRKVQFMKYMKQIKPVMICIDSLSSCSGSKSEEENRASFAQPIYWLNTQNGSTDEFPPCTIMLLHHTSKSTGEARGSTAISAACAEVWRVETPTEDNKLKPDQRLITVAKSRMGRNGERLLQMQRDDLTCEIVEWQKPDAIQTRAGSLTEKILQRLLVAGKPMTMRDLCADQLVGGSVAAVKKTLTRMVNRGVIKIAETRSREDSKGKPENYYVPAGRKLSPCAGTQMGVSQEHISSAGTEDKRDTSSENSKVSRLAETIQDLNGTPSENQEKCPVKDLSDTNESAPVDIAGHTPRTGAVTDEERQQSINKWKI